MGCCQTNEGSSYRRRQKDPDQYGSSKKVIALPTYSQPQAQYKSNKGGVVVDPYHQTSNNEANMNGGEYQDQLKLRAEAIEKRLNAQKLKNISPESLVDMKLKEEKMRRVEELAKKSDGKYYMTVRRFIYF